uniref:Dienelactone hydrolase-like enzyme n=1 Tax=Aureimonas altamirensis TaxID=370622 RepID=A0A0N7KWY0_9HYPH|nr:dienelactone hydrolase-like enzyme [Aureimonas altamirensis]
MKHHDRSIDRTEALARPQANSYLGLEAVISLPDQPGEGPGILIFGANNLVSHVKHSPHDKSA